MIPWDNLAAIVLLMLASAFFAASEIGLIAVGRLRARQLADEGVKGGERLHRLLRRPSRLLATVLVAITSLLYTIEVLATKTALDLGIGLWVPLLVVPFFVVVIAEVTPILYASQNPDPVALAAARVIPTVRVLLYPVVALFTGIVNLILRVFGLRMQSELGVTEEEIKMAIEVAEEEGVIQEDEGDLLTGVMEFHDKRVREVMVPRVDMVCVEQNTPIGDVLRATVEAHHSRLPVYADTVDSIVGVVYAKDLIPYVRGEGEATATAGDIARPAHYLPDTRQVDDVLHELQQVQRTMAIVYGEHGGTAGLLTVEDLLEEIVGEIVDEHDVEESEYEQLDENVWLLDPRLTLRQIERLSDVALLRQIPAEQLPRMDGLTEADTVRELLLTIAGKRPDAGDRFQLGEVELTVQRVSGLRIERVQMERRAGSAGAVADAPGEGGGATG